MRQDEILAKKVCADEFPAWRISSGTELTRLRKEKSAADWLLERRKSRSEASALLILVAVLLLQVGVVVTEGLR